MKMIVGVVVLTLVASAASAGCYGTGAFRQCFDDSGNSYSINKLGNTTTLNGYNAQTGSTWSQRSTTLGNTTTHNGYSSDGGNWTMTQRSIGGNTYTSGVDSDGNYFSQTCTKYGCY
jgi:hypothetical protein